MCLRVCTGFAHLSNTCIYQLFAASLKLLLYTICCEVHHFLLCMIFFRMFDFISSSRPRPSRPFPLASNGTFSDVAFCPRGLAPSLCRVVRQRNPLRVHSARFPNSARKQKKRRRYCDYLCNGNKSLAVRCCCCCCFCAAIAVSCTQEKCAPIPSIRLYNFPLPFISFNRWKCLELLSNARKNAKRLERIKCK